MSDDADLLREFLVECRENLDQLENELMGFDGVAASPQMIAAVFRSLHTVKGTAGFFGFDTLQHVAHTAENLLAYVREGVVHLTTPIVSCLLDVVDVCRTIAASIEAGEGEGSGDHSALVSKLEAFAPAEDVAPAEAAPAPPPPVAVAAEPEHHDAEPAAKTAAVSRDTTVRVDTRLLDQLMDLAGELVLARNQLLQLAATSADSALVRAAQRLDSVTSELQEGVMRTRMQPIGNAWQKLPRVVRDLASELGKHIKLELDGQDTALDRSILEAIRDPLTHLVRNACDHGIERPERRQAAGKSPEGTLRLSASHRGGHVSIEIEDDGNGIDANRVRDRAVERGILSADRAATMSEAELVQLIFAPGFSTAEKVTSVSGRGVGMDVVKTNVEAIGGTVNVLARAGQGTTVRIDIPLTLAIIPALLVGANSQPFAIPEGALVEILRIESDEEAGVLGVEYIHGSPVYRRHGELIPLVVLGNMLAGTSGGVVEMPAYVAVVTADGRKFGVVVDDLYDPEEIVVKPLGHHIQGIPFYAGATILGDGRIALILDIRGLADEAGLTSRRPTSKPVDVAVAVGSEGALLVVRGRDRRLALPLSEVCRLEELPASAVERAGRLEVVQYRNSLLPLIRLDHEPTDRLTVVVHAASGRNLGLVVDKILDVVQADPTVDGSTAEHGVRGSAVIAGFATDLIDVGALAEAAGLVYGRAS